MNIEILAHRGLWSSRSECNSLDALCAALERGFGIETDIQYRSGELVISHDPPNRDSTALKHLLDRYAQMQATTALALNIKCDGLATILDELLQHYKITNYFVFDMSIPDTLSYLNRKMTTFSRQSEYEPEAVLYSKCQGVWLDSFENDWYTSEVIQQHLQKNKYVSVVSPELHGRKHDRVWQTLFGVAPNGIATADDKKLLVCTDFPELFRGSIPYESN